MKNLMKAVNKVMAECTTIEKGSQVGSGSYGYKGVKDSQLKLMLSRSMRENGLAIFPTHIDESTDIHRYTANGKEKMSVFTKVNCKYILAHESGESIELAGIGHSVDNQDKGAGKATTYSLKYALMYTFMVAAGEIDDADDYHSDEIEQPPAKKASDAIDIGDEKYDSAVVKVISGDITVDKILTKYHLTKRAEKKLREIENAE